MDITRVMTESFMMRNVGRSVRGVRRSEWGKERNRRRPLYIAEERARMYGARVIDPLQRATKRGTRRKKGLAQPSHSALLLKPPLLGNEAISTLLHSGVNKPISHKLPSSPLKMLPH
jgi:hypothetical protein